MVSALPPQVSVVIFGTKMATVVCLLMNFLEGFEFMKFGMKRVKMLEITKLGVIFQLFSRSSPVVSQVLRLHALNTIINIYISTLQQNISSPQCRSTWNTT
jgi:hypothetical protein